MRVNKQFYQVHNSDKRFKILVGGTRSGKTYAVMQYLVYRALACKEGEEFTATLVRKWLPSVKESIYLDFQEILGDYGHYDENLHNKSDMKYDLNGCVFKFMATADQPDRLRSMKRDILYINEVNELSKEEFRQLNLRTKEEVIMDYNPSMSEHWIYDLEDNRSEDVDVFLSTYHDNVFLTKEQIREIEELRKTDPEAWRVYGEGKRATVRKGRIYKGWEKIYKLPDDGDITWGIDFGWHPDPTAIIKCVKRDENFYLKEIMYSNKATEEDIAQAIRNEGYRGEVIWCDHNQKQIIESLKRAGYNATEARKGTGSVIDGINFIKRARVFFTRGSSNLEKEYNMYSWKMKRGFDPDDPNAWEQNPEDKNNHMMDAMRYAIYSSYFVGRKFFVI
jgi:phage terminase large subunit